MSTPPVRYENYPPEQNGTPASPVADDSTPLAAPEPAPSPRPVVRAFVPERVVADESGPRLGRRKLMTLLVALPAAAVVGGFSFFSRSQPQVLTTAIPEPIESYSADAPEPEPGTIVAGDFSATLPAGWNEVDSGQFEVTVAKGTNRLTAVSVSMEADTPAVDEIVDLSRDYYDGFAGKIGAPVDRSSAEVQRASLDGVGTFHGKAARLLVELWSNDTEALLVVRILTAKPASRISAEAQQMVDELSQGF